MNDSVAIQSMRFRVEWVAVSILLMLLGAAIATVLYREHILVAERESDRLQVQARVIDDNLIRQLQGVNNALMAIRNELERFELVATGASTVARLKLLTDAIPGVRTMVIVNIQGVIVASSRPELLGATADTRDYFVTPRQRPDRAVLYVSEPFKSALGPWVIAVGRVLTNEQGAFAGVVLATLSPEYFEVVLQSVIYAPDMRASIVHAGGQIFVTALHDERIVGVNLARPGSMFSRHQESGQIATVATAPTVVAGNDRMIALRTLDRAALHMDRPLVASVGREVSAIYLPWRDQAMRFGIFYAVVVLASSLGLYFSQRQRKVLDRLTSQAAKERQEGAERLELALRSADLGLWDLQVATGDFVINAREREILGFSPDDLLPQADAWRDLIHPDDRALVAAAAQPHLRGQADAYECEHRMRHRDGHYIWLSSRAMIVERDLNQRPVRMVGTHLDITERKRITAQLVQAAVMLQDSEEQLRQVTDNLPALVSRWDLEQRFRFANRAFRDWLGLEPASLLGRTVRQVYGEEAYRGFHHHIDTALSGTRVVYERELSTPHGRRQVQVTLVPQRGSDGSVQGIYGLVSDLTERHEAERRRALSEERLSLALEGSGLALFDWDIPADRMYHSAQVSAMRDEPAVETTASPAELRSFVHPDDVGALLSSLKAAVKSEVSVYHAEFRIRRARGDWLWVRARGRVVERSDSGRALRLAGTYANIHIRKVAEDRLRHRADFDALTGLPNRASFIELLQHAMASSTCGGSLALMFLDIDHFKNVNDTLGHEAGDQLLKVFATRMRECVRQSDIVARLAGDEFTVILEGLRGPNDAKTLAGKLVQTLRAPIALAGKLFVITASVGVAMQRDGESNDAELLRRADVALYEAKRRGRDGFFCEEDDKMDRPLGTENCASAEPIH